MQSVFKPELKFYKLTCQGRLETNVKLNVFDQHGLPFIFLT